MYISADGDRWVNSSEVALAAEYLFGSFAEHSDAGLLYELLLPDALEDLLYRLEVSKHVFINEPYTAVAMQIIQTQK